MMKNQQLNSLFGICRLTALTALSSVFLMTGCRALGPGSAALPIGNRMANQVTEPPARLAEMPSQKRVPTSLQSRESAQSVSPAAQLMLEQGVVGESADITVAPSSSLDKPQMVSPAAGSWPKSQPTSNQTEFTFRGQSPQEYGSPRVAALQTPETQNQQFGNPPSSYQNPSITTGNSGEPYQLVTPNAPGGVGYYPQDYTNMQGVADLNVVVGETQTGRINFGGAFNSDNGLVGQFVIDERNFDITAFPRSFREIADGTAFRGAGQTFRLELVPGDEVQRYLVSFGEPYLFNTAISFNFSAYLFDRQYFDWDEQRLGGRLALGYRLTPDLSVSAGVRLENVKISDPRVGTSPQLNAALGDTDLYVGHVGIVNDTRDHPFMATEGSYLSMTYNQAFGEFDYARGDIDYRRYRLLYQRPDGSGRHTLSFGTRLGFSGSQTPIFENYFAGGFSSMRGFDFRGASPSEGGVRVGGEFQWLNSLEYTFPLTADDMIKGVMFCDFGTVEESITVNSENFRVAPGFGFRVHMPAAGIGAPLAFDFAFPVSSSEFDDEQVFSFYLGVLR